MILCDAHNHLQDARLQPWLDSIVRELPRFEIRCMVVNGTCESDWPAVARLARQHDWIKPSFGLHPWHVAAASDQWKDRLLRYLAEFPAASVGEIGLDRWISNPDVPAQMAAFRWQLEVASIHARPATLHCLRAWGLLLDQLRSAHLPAPGFLLHSYSGPVEMVAEFAELGGYFSLSPYFTSERKAQQALAFRSVPQDRLLAETDAPEMWPPANLNPFPLSDESGNPLNHPFNLTSSYRKLAELHGMPEDAMARQIETNFLRLFSSAPLAPAGEQNSA